MTDTETHEFSNGLQLVLERLPKAKSAGVAVGFPVGGRTEKPEVSGISHYLEHIIFKGTKSVTNVDAAFRKLGARNNAMTDVDTTVYVAECPKKHSVKTLELWLHLLSQASIDPEQFERERGVILSEYFISGRQPRLSRGKNRNINPVQKSPAVHHRNRFRRNHKGRNKLRNAQLFPLFLQPVKHGHLGFGRPHNEQAHRLCEPPRLLDAALEKSRHFLQDFSSSRIFSDRTSSPDQTSPSWSGSQQPVGLR